MNIVAVVAVSVLSGALPPRESNAADAPHPCFITSTDPVEVKIVRDVCEGYQAEREYWAALDAERHARKLVQEEKDSEKRYALLEAWAVADNQLTDAQDRMQGNFDDAIQLTMSHYGIAPSQGDGDIRGGPVTGAQAHWLPKYYGRIDRTAPIYREIARPDGSVYHPAWQPDADPQKRPGSLTWPDGRVDIYDEVIDRTLTIGSPRVLAYILDHESVHFDQLRNGHWATLNSREVEAYRQSRKNAARFGLSDDERRDIDRFFFDNIGHVARQGLGLEKRPNNLPTPDEESQNSDAWARLSAAVEQTDVERDGLQKELKQERADRNALNAVANRMFRQEAEKEQSEAAYKNLNDWIAKACQSIDNVVATDWAAWHENYAKIRPGLMDWAKAAFPPEHQSCEGYLASQLLQRRSENDDPPENYWVFNLAEKAQEQGRLAASDDARQVLETWLQHECVYGTVPAPLTREQVAQAYADLVVRPPVPNLWSSPIGVSCPDLLMNALLWDKMNSRPFRTWDDWFNLARQANERNHAPSQVPAPPQQPQPNYPDPGPDRPGHNDNPPSIPYCRYQGDWCKEPKPK